MIAFLARLFARAAPALSEAGPRDAAALAAIHSASFRRGWSESEFEHLLAEKNIIAHRAMAGGNIVGFIMSRLAAEEAEILSIAVSIYRRGRGLGRNLLDLHLRRLAALGVRSVFLEVEDGNRAARKLYARAGFTEVGRRPGYYPQDNGKTGTALVLRRDIA